MGEEGVALAVGGVGAPRARCEHSFYFEFGGHGGRKSAEEPAVAWAVAGFAAACGLRGNEATCRVLWAALC